MDTERESRISSKRLDHLLVVGHAMRRLGIAELIDERTAHDPRNVATHGRCVEALVASILLGSHTLYRVSDLLEPFDLEVGLGWSSPAACFHDNRIGKALDATLDIGLIPLYSGAIVRAVRQFDLDLARLHTDTSSLRVFGEYLDSREPEDPDDPQARPHVTRGHSKDHRPDLKQVVYGVTVTSDGAVPVFGRIASGNRNDTLEARFTLKQLARVLPDPRETTLVGDSKLFSGKTLLAAREHELHVLTMLPRSVGLWHEVFLAYREYLDQGGEPNVLKAVYPDPTEDDPDPTEPEKLWRGRSFDVVYAWEDDEKTVHRLPLRALFVESTTLREQKTASVTGQREKFAKKLARAIARVEKEDFGCEADARKAAVTLVEQHGSPFHVVHHDVRTEEQRVKRGRRGRPPKSEPVRTQTVWRLSFRLEADPNAFEVAVLQQSSFVLVTTHAETDYPDARAFREYQEQSSVEGSIRWAKGPLAVTPLFLKTRDRIAALGLVYVLAVMVYALIQRDVRLLLAAEGVEFPGNKGFTKKPTTEVIFRLFEGVNATRLVTGPASAAHPAVVTNVTTAQVDALRLIGHPILDDARVRFEEPTVPRPRSRGYRPPPEPEEVGEKPEA